jgi:GTP cyclohydrolase IA
MSDAILPPPSAVLDDLAEAYAQILDQTVSLTEGVEDTPRRAAKAWRELTSGYDVDVEALFTTFDREGFDEMIALRGVPFVSLCEHHLLPFVGEASVVYLPSTRIVGLSKIARVVQAYSRRLQVQERLTQQIADAMVKHLDPVGVLVHVTAHHTCMSARGIRSQGDMETSVTRGAMREKPASRDEAMRMIGR